MLYIFSDGFYDQFGGDKGRKMFTRNFKQILMEIHALDIEKQHKELESKFDEWKGTTRQIDDVLVVGIQIA
jgi:hypothetical protein